MDLKQFFLNTTYFDANDREMVKILWEECLPQGHYNYIKSPENFKLLHSPKLKTSERFNWTLLAYTECMG